MGFQGQMAVKVTPNCVRKGNREGSRRFAGGIMIDKVESRTQIWRRQKRNVDVI